MKTRILVVLLALMMITAGTAMANTLADIVQRGELRVAVQSGAAPYAFVDKNGEQTGSMDELLQEVAEYYDSEVEYELESLSSAIEPVLTIVIGAIVLILALGVFLPMWNISSVALNK